MAYYFDSNPDSKSCEQLIRCEINGSIYNFIYACSDLHFLNRNSYILAIYAPLFGNSKDTSIAL